MFSCTRRALSKPVAFPPHSLHLALVCLETSRCPPARASHALHLLANLLVDLEKLGHAAVHAHALALVELAFPVVGGNALLLAGPRESGGEMISLRNQVVCTGKRIYSLFAFSLIHAKDRGAGILKPYRVIISVRSFISASTAEIFSSDVGCGRPNPRNDILNIYDCRLIECRVARIVCGAGSFSWAAVPVV